MNFLNVIIRRNPSLIKVAVEMHQEGLIPPNTVVVDLDTVRKNALVIKGEADRYGISCYFMTKQFGRNPLVSKVISDLGLKSVAVDIEDVKCLHKYGIPIGHVGHLSQIPRNEIEYVLKEVTPEVITVYSIEKAMQISKIASKLGIKQKLLIRPIGRGDFFYPCQEGGIPEKEIIEATRTINSFPNVRVVGVTSFPCFRLNYFTRKVEPLPNLDTIVRVAKTLEEKLGLTIEQINAPADNSAKTMEILHEKGATHAEPGHAFTGTTPWHAFEDLPEVPAWIYVTEVSHILGDTAYVFGGNFMPTDMCIGIWDYKYHQFRIQALVGSDPESIINSEIYGYIIPGYFDYYEPLFLNDKVRVNIGDTVVMGLRNQVFATRAKIAIIRGISEGRPELLGIFDRCGNMLGEHDVPVNIDEVKALLKRLY